MFFRKLSDFIPNHGRYFRNGVSRAEINALEQTTGFNFPDSVKALYSVHNGEKEYFGLFFGLQWLSLDEIATQWLKNKEYHDEYFATDIISFEKDKIQEDYFLPGWVPIAYDHAGNYIGIDFSPGPKGKMGQIINFGRDERTLFVISNSFDELLELLIHHFECGNCKVIFDNDHPYVSWRENRHFFDDLKEIFAPHLDQSGEILLDEKWNEFLQDYLGCVPVTNKDLAKITTLRLLNSNITDLSPLVYFNNLKELIASGLNIENFGPISHLKGLKKLYLAKTSLKDLGFLKGLRELKVLSIGNTQVKDITDLSDLPSLQQLSLENLQISDLTPLTTCKKLKSLDLSGVQSESYTVIKECTKLVSLNLSGIVLDDLEVLEGKDKLKELTFEAPKNKDYQVLKDLKNIEYVTCSFDLFKATKDIIGRKIHYAISGETSEQEWQQYRNYCRGK